MSVEKIKALERRFFEEINKGKATAMAAMDKFYAADLVLHLSTGEDIHGLKNVKQVTNEEFSAFPDFHYAIDDIVVEGNKAAVRLTATGTHKGEFMGISPTNKKVTVRVILIDRFSGGKVVEEWTIGDNLSLMQQLGAVPAPKKET